MNKRLYTVSVGIEATGGPVPLVARFADNERLVETHVLQVVAMMDADEACDMAIAEVFESYGNQCNLIEYQCGDGVPAH